jgi:glutathione synthase/RimK-type ligase-like ATP-grasp enzyme
MALKLRIVPYKKGSESAKLLADELSKVVGYHVWRGPIKPKRHNILWGYHGLEGVFTNRDFNAPSSIGLARDKLQTFKQLSGKVNLPAFTTDKSIAQGWLNEGKTVVVRKVLCGQGGAGIAIVEPTGTLPDAPLYVQYVKKKQEFRVHVVGQQVIDVQEKRRRNGVEVNNLIRNLDNGWVFCHENIDEPEDLRLQSTEAVKNLGLHFGAVDCIYNGHLKKTTILEVNTAPGLCPSTATKYAHAIKTLVA